MNRIFKSGIAALAFVTLLLGAGTVSGNLEAASCKQACVKYRSCTVEYWKQRGRTPSTSEKRKLYAGCMNACKKHRQKVLACYAKSKNSCVAYWNCVTKTYK